jgi:hypothetical protein
MNIRRSSGEVVNATLLETFLALVFLIFGLALFESQRADNAEADRDRAPSQRVVDSLSAIVNQNAHRNRARDDSLRVLASANDSLRGVLISKYPPDCEPGAEPAEWLTVTLLGKDRMRVLVHRGEFGLSAGAEFEIGSGEFATRFAPVRVISETRRCRYLVRVEDTQGTSKQDFKLSLAAVSAVFRPRNYLR